MPRRTHAAIAAALVVLTTTGGAALLGSQPADALTISGLTVGNVQRDIGPNGQLTGVQADVAAEYEYQSSHELSKVELVLYAAPSDGSFQPLDTVTLSDPGTNGSGTVTLAGDLTSLDSFATDTFDAQQGRTVGTEVRFKLVLKAYRSGARVGVADASETATVSIHREELQVAAQVAGEGSLTVRTE